MATTTSGTSEITFNAHADWPGVYLFRVFWQFLCLWEKGQRRGRFGCNDWSPVKAVGSGRVKAVADSDNNIVCWIDH